MCWCTPGIRTPCCGKLECVPPPSNTACMTDDEIVTNAHIREALGVGEKPMLSELPAIAAELRKDAERFRWLVDNVDDPSTPLGRYPVAPTTKAQSWRQRIDKWMRR